MKYIPAGVTRLVGRQILKAQANSPALLFGAGVAGVITTTVVACRATLKVEEVLDKAQDTLSDINKALVQESTTGQGRYSERDAQKDRAFVYIRAGKELVVLYGPAVLCGTLSIAALTRSHNILNKRNAALTAAYSAVSKTLNDYRVRVREELGEEKERELYYPLEKCEIEEIDPETGKKTKKEVTNRRGSMYSRMFGKDTSKEWSPQPDYNIVFLKSQQRFWNDRLQSYGHVFLNEVYDALGLERSAPGAVVGWIKGEGDDYIDFGVFDKEMDPAKYDFFTGYEDSVLLDFNVSGTIYKKI